MATSLAMQKILNANIDDIGKDMMESLFASYHDRENNQFVQAPFSPTEVITLTNKDYKWVQGSVKTTVGMLFLNRILLEKTGVIDALGYWNEPIDRDGMEALTDEINSLALTNRISIDQLIAFVDMREKSGFWAAAYLSVSITPSLIRPMENVNKRKAELFEQYKNEINSNNPVLQTMTVNKIEKELMSMVRENLKNDSGYDLYRSGDGNLDNNYKTINVMRGSVFNNATKRYDVVESSLMGGVKKKDITAFSNSVLAAAYPSAVGTAEAGYLSKILLALLQSEHIDPNPNSDCGTQVTIPIEVTKKNAKYLLYRYINDNGKKVLTDLHNIKNYIGKTINIYSPQCCEREAICSKCAGLVFHNLGVKNIGMLTTQITQKMLNIKLKSKHDLSQNAGIIPAEYVFLNNNKYFSVDEGNMVNKVKMKMFIPRLIEELDGFVREPTSIRCMAIFPVKFYDNSDNEILSTMMIIPAQLDFNIYNEVQEDLDNYIVTYEPGSNICSLGIQKTVTNVEYFINQVYLYSKNPQLPYNLLTFIMFRCLEINGIDLTGASIVYELLARRVCRTPGDRPFSTVYGKQPGVDPMSYTKLPFREAVQRAGVLQSILFQDISRGMNKGLAQTLNGKMPTATPLEAIIKA